ncbi:hypothetical protein BDW75DRAFT_60774 [Aspergillus navahoensis]
MHLSLSASILLAFSLARPTIAGRPYFCPLALDAKLLQVPYCCEGFVPAPDSKVAFEGVNCAYRLLSSYVPSCVLSCLYTGVNWLRTDANDCWRVGIDVSGDGDFVKTCPKGGTPKCCYSIGLKVICTTEVGDGVDE